MPPSATETLIKAADTVKEKIAPVPEKSSITSPAPEQENELKLEINHKEPLKPTGILAQFKYFDVTPVIGREFVDVDLAEWLRAPNSDDLIRELAVTVSRRGVVFFRKQDNITNDLQKELVQRLGQLTGKPESSTLHIHPVVNSGREEGGKDDEISVISSQQAKRIYSRNIKKTQSQQRQWHSDITFEPVPSDHALLRLTQLPKVGGDTLWASGYEVYDPGVQRGGGKKTTLLYSEVRGSPENVGEILEAIHPVIRTNPVTGWKSVFAVGAHVAKINGLTEEESKHFLNWFVQLIVENHDLQVRNRWQNVNDLAIWDNRSVYHAATPDYVHEDLGERSGSRAVSIGEKPYFDPVSVNRRHGLAQEQ